MVVYITMGKIFYHSCSRNLELVNKHEKTVSKGIKEAEYDKNEYSFPLPVDRH
jgi:hypothetical protein